MNLALLTDGLRAEREQGITIDVAYRYFATPTRKFIIADTPGHIQYTRNMVTGASTADLALILVDARHGIIEQSRRHSFLASLLGVPHLVLCVNKMDLVDYDQEVFERIRLEFREFAAKLDVHDLTFIPISALKGDNVVERSREHAVVRRSVAAAPARSRAHRLGPEPHRLPLPGAVRHPPPRRPLPRLSRLRGPGRRWHVQARRRSDRPAVGLLVAHRRDRDRRRPRRRGNAADVGHDPTRGQPRRQPGRHDQPAAQPAPGRPGHRGDGLLVQRPQQARGRIASTPSSTRRSGPARS